MLFNSYAFIFVFVPITLFFYYLARPDRNRDYAMAILILASIIFYGWWDLRFLPLLIASTFANYWVACRVGNRTFSKSLRRVLLAAGIAANLSVLGYFKYANFFIDTAHHLTGARLAEINVILPLGISFFTFQKIAYLVDVFRNEKQPYNLVYWCWFVFFFPQLVAGPIVHHAEMAPQYRARTLGPISENLSIGLTIFILGLFKKTILADQSASYADPIFLAAGQGTPLFFIEAWTGALFYSLQIYFDFSGYSDMAVGLARMFGFRLPINFDSPYKAKNIIEFWRCWHITLSRFIRDYLYIPLGGNRKGLARRHVNIMAVMLLGGLWHGPSWTFVAWGGLHGAYLLLNHAWARLWDSFGMNVHFPGALARAMTFIAVTVAWVLFRAPDFPVAKTMFAAMAGQNGVSFPAEWSVLTMDTLAGIRFDGIFGSIDLEDKRWLPGWLLAGLLIVWFSPNAYQIMAAYNPALETGIRRAAPQKLTWSASAPWAVTVAALAVTAVLSLSRPSPFIYWMF